MFSLNWLAATLANPKPTKSFYPVLFDIMSEVLAQAINLLKGFFDLMVWTTSVGPTLQIGSGACDVGESLPGSHDASGRVRARVPTSKTFKNNQSLHFLKWFPQLGASVE